MPNVRGRLVRALAVAAVAAMVLAACGGDSDDDAGETGDLPTTTETPSSAANPTTTPTQDPDRVALKDLYRQYWDAYSEAASGPKLDPILFKGITTEGFMERKLAAIERELKANDLRLTGDAKLSNIRVKLSGDSAQVEACLDKSQWKLLQDGEPIQSDFGDPEPDVMSAKRTQNGWLLDDNMSRKKASIEC